MKNAINSAPKVCRCGRKLKKPECSFTPVNPNLHWHPHSSERRWHIDCVCGSILLWSYPNVWKQSHVLEIGRTLEIVG